MKYFAALTLFFVATIARADVPDYTREIAPIFKQFCGGCHNPSEHEGKLSLEKYSEILAGGENGAVLVPGKRDESLLYKLLSGKEESRMPPEDEPQPSAEQIETIARWIDAGAKGPKGVEPDPTILAVPRIEPKVATSAPLSALACNPGGDTLALARDGAVDLVGRVDRSLLHRLSGHRGRVTFVAFSGDGQLLVSAAGEPGLFGEVQLWNVKDGSLIKTFTGHRDSLYAAVLSPDGATLATSSYDQAIKLWDVKTGNELHTLTGHNDAVYDIAFRPDGRVLASASGDRTLKLWDVATGTRLDTLSQSLKELYTVAFHPDGRKVIAGGVDNRIRVWNVSSDAKENTNPLDQWRFAHEAPIIRLVYSRDGKTLVSASEDKSIKVWDTESMRIRGTLEPQPDWPAALAITLDGSTLFVGRLDGSLAEYPLGSVAEVAAEIQPLPTISEVITYGDQPTIDQLPKTAEKEPNNAASQATTISAPSVTTGVIHPVDAGVPDTDLFRFDARAGDVWIIETNASRAESKLDSRIEVLNVDGQPVERLLLRAVRDSELEFRSEDSSDRGMRLAGWEEMELNNLIYMEGEVLKLFMQRRGPDADASFFPEDGPRHTYFDTSGRTHALGAKCYIVQPFAVGTSLPYNGLPVISLKYENDDSGDRKLGSDSRLTFTAPADGAYLVRVTDMRGFGGDNFAYQLIVRRPQPDFNVAVSDENPAVPADSGKKINVFVDRTDGFAGEVRVDISGLPPGFYATSPIVVEAGHRVAHGVIFAHPQAQPPTEANTAITKITATANVAGRAVVKETKNLGKITLAEKPRIIVRLAAPGEGPRLPTGDAATSLEFPQPAELTIAPGATITCQLLAERNGFDGIINFEARNLPHGVIVDNIGLNGIQLLPGQTERTLYLSAERWVSDQDRLFHVSCKEENGQLSLPLLLRVRRPAEVAGK